MENTASEYFGAMVAEYDSLLRRAVPRYDEMIERTVGYTPPGRRRILELGCGTGNLSVAMADAFPSATFTLVDASREMLDVARTRLTGVEVTCVEARFEELELEPRSFDLVTSCIALHHVIDKAALFRALHAVLEPGGYLVYSDQMAGGSDAYSAINWKGMTDFWERPGHLDAEECRSLTEHGEQHDHYVSVIEQLRHLQSAGFAELDCVWRNWMWGVISART